MHYKKMTSVIPLLRDTTVKCGNDWNLLEALEKQLMHL